MPKCSKHCRFSFFVSLAYNTYERYFVCVRWSREYGKHFSISAFLKRKCPCATYDMKSDIFHWSCDRVFRVTGLDLSFRLEFVSYGPNGGGKIACALLYRQRSDNIRTKTKNSYLIGERKTINTSSINHIRKIVYLYPCSNSNR